MPLWHGLFLFLLMGMQVWAGYHSIGIYDTHRDLYFAQSIVMGTELPLNGPAIYGKMHLGPLWFYVLALPLWLFDNAAAIPVTTAVLGALKYPLAYVLGRHFGGPRSGLLFSAACLFPGWSSFTLMALTHSTVVETTLLLGALAATLFYRKKTTTGAAALLGLAIGLMFHAHPTTLVPAMIMVLLSLVKTHGWKKKVWHLCIAGGVSFLFLVPMLIGQALYGFPDLPTLTLYGRNEPSWPSLQRMGGLLSSLLFYGGGYVARFWLEWPLSWCRGFLWVLGGTFAWVLVGLALAIYHNPARRWWVAALLVVLLVQTVYVMVLRSITPFWMIFAHLPVLAALCAIGLEEGVGIKKVGLPLTVITLTFWFGVSMAGLFYLGRASHVLFIDNPGPGRQGLMNISDIEPLGEGQLIRVARISFGELYLIGTKLCQPVAVYGHYAKFVDESFGAGAARYCGKTDQVALGGKADPSAAWVGLRDYAWASLGLEPEEWLGSLGIVRPEKIWGDPEPLPIGNPHIYPPRTDPVAVQNFGVTVDALPSRTVMISVRHGGLRVKEAWLGDVPISAAYYDLPGTFVFRTSQSQLEKNLRWHFVLEGDPRYIDVVSFTGKRK